MRAVMPAAGGAGGSSPATVSVNTEVIAISVASRRILETFSIGSHDTAAVLGSSRVSARAATCRLHRGRTLEECQTVFWRPSRGATSWACFRWLKLTSSRSSQVVPIVVVRFQILLAGSIGQRENVREGAMAMVTCCPAVDGLLSDCSVVVVVASTDWLSAPVEVALFVSPE